MKLLFSTAKDVKKEKEKEKSEKTKQNKLTNSQGCKKITNSFSSSQFSGESETMSSNHFQFISKVWNSGETEKFHIAWVFLDK